VQTIQRPLLVWAGSRKLTGCPGECSLSLIIPYESTYVSLRQRQPAAAFEPALSALALALPPRNRATSSSSSSYISSYAGLTSSYPNNLVLKLVFLYQLLYIIIAGLTRR
jgi:hypothetical protein